MFSLVPRPSDGCSDSQLLDHLESRQRVTVDSVKAAASAAASLPEAEFAFLHAYHSSSSSSSAAVSSASSSGSVSFPRSFSLEDRARLSQVLTQSVLSLETIEPNTLFNFLRSQFRSSAALSPPVDSSSEVSHALISVSASSSGIPLPRSYSAAIHSCLLESRSEFDYVEQADILMRVYRLNASELKKQRSQWGEEKFRKSQLKRQLKSHLRRLDQEQTNQRQKQGQRSYYLPSDFPSLSLYQRWLRSSALDLHESLLRLTEEIRLINKKEKSVINQSKGLIEKIFWWRSATPAADNTAADEAGDSADSERERERLRRKAEDESQRALFLFFDELGERQRQSNEEGDSDGTSDDADYISEYWQLLTRLCEFHAPSSQLQAINDNHRGLNLLANWRLSATQRQILASYGHFYFVSECYRELCFLQLLLLNRSFAREYWAVLIETIERVEASRMHTPLTSAEFQLYYSLVLECLSWCTQCVAFFPALFELSKDKSEEPAANRPGSGAPVARSQRAFSDTDQNPEYANTAILMNLVRQSNAEAARAAEIDTGNHAVRAAVRALKRFWELARALREEGNDWKLKFEMAPIPGQQRSEDRLSLEISEESLNEPSLEQFLLPSLRRGLQFQFQRLCAAAKRQALQLPPPAFNVESEGELFLLLDTLNEYFLYFRDFNEFLFAPVFSFVSPLVFEVSHEELLRSMTAYIQHRIPTDSPSGLIDFYNHLKSFYTANQTFSAASHDKFLQNIVNELANLFSPVVQKFIEKFCQEIEAKFLKAAANAPVNVLFASSLSDLQDKIKRFTAVVLSKPYSQKQAQLFCNTVAKLIRLFLEQHSILPNLAGELHVRERMTAAAYKAQKKNASVPIDSPALGFASPLTNEFLYWIELLMQCNQALESTLNDLTGSAAIEQRLPEGALVATCLSDVIHRSAVGFATEFGSFFSDAIVWSKPVEVRWDVKKVELELKPILAFLDRRLNSLAQRRVSPDFIKELAISVCHCIGLNLEMEVRNIRSQQFHWAPNAALPVAPQMFQSFKHDATEKNLCRSQIQRIVFAWKVVKEFFSVVYQIPPQLFNLTPLSLPGNAANRTAQVKKSIKPPVWSSIPALSLEINRFEEVLNLIGKPSADIGRLINAPDQDSVAYLQAVSITKFELWEWLVYRSKREDDSAATEFIKANKDKKPKEKEKEKKGLLDRLKDLAD